MNDAADMNLNTVAAFAEVRAFSSFEYEGFGSGPHYRAARTMPDAGHTRTMGDHPDVHEMSWRVQSMRHVIV